jgi:hypothetical protein
MCEWLELLVIGDVTEGGIGTKLGLLDGLKKAPAEAGAGTLRILSLNVESLRLLLLI